MGKVLLGGLALAIAACGDLGAPGPIEPGSAGEPASREQRAPLSSAPPEATWGAEVKLLAPDATRDDIFGGQIAVSGDTVLVSAPPLGAVYVFVRDIDEWTFVQKLESPVQPTYASFGSSLDIQGDTVLVGEPGGTLHPGNVYVFERSAGMFVLSQRLTPSVTSPAEEFGFSVSLDGDLAAVGAWNQLTTPMTDEGSSAYLFERTGGTFREIQRIVSTDIEARLGTVVDVSGDTLLVTAPYRIKGTYQGSAYFYVRSGSTFVLEQAFDGPRPNEFMGQIAALDGDTAIISLSGGMNEFTRAAGVWSQGPLIGYGWVALQGDRLAFGNPSADAMEPAAGDVRVYEREQGIWAETATIAASDGVNGDRFGMPVDFDGNTLVAAAQLRDEPARDEGAVYVYRYAFGLGAPCAVGDDCLSARCIDGRCCDQDCTGSCAACSEAEGADEDGHCTLVPRGDPGSPSCGTLACTGEGPACTDCTADADCPENRYCADGGRCERRKADGDACDLAARDCAVEGCRACESESCVDGVCCDDVCEGQCEACAEPGSEGECVAVTGEARGEREPCDPSGDPACAARCDGSERAECTYVDSSERCGGQCEADEEVIASCDGQGRCVESDPVACAPYVCGADACLTSCEATSDCRAGHRCAAGECVPAVARCSADGTESITSQGESVPCFPYRCDESSGECRSDCDTTGECAPGRVCDPDSNTCVEAPESPGAESGCGCRLPASSPRRGALQAFLVACALLALRRRRYPQVRTSTTDVGDASAVS